MSLGLGQGVRNMLIASFFFALMQVCVKLLPHIPAVEIVFFRSIISLFLSLAILIPKRVNPFGTNRKLLVLRGLTGAIALILFFLTIQKIPLASAVTLQFLSPVFTTILGIFIVREKVYARQFAFFAISFIGVLVVKGFDTRIPVDYLILGLVSAFFSGLAYNMIRKIRTTEHPLVIVLYFPLVTVPITGFISIPMWVNPSGWDWLWLLLVGVFTQLAQYYMTLSYQKEDLSSVAILKYVGIIYALGFGYFIFNETMPLMSLAGIALVLLGVILNVRFKNKVKAT